MTRRTVLCSIVSQIAFPQNATRLAISNPGSGFRLEQYGNPQLPTVALFLPGATNPSAVIEMPEHAWRKEKADDEQAWFYKMYGSDRSLKGHVKWSKLDNALAFSMRTPSGWLLNSRAMLESDGVAISHEIIGPSVRRLAAVTAVTCVKLYRPFTDVFLDRTFIHHKDGLDLIASETPARTGRNAEEWLPCRYIANVGKNNPSGKYRVEVLDGVTRYFKSRSADAAFLATESLPGGWTVATFAHNCDSVFTNPARTCHHADPIAHEVSGGRATLRLKVYVVKGNANDAWRQVSSAERLG